MNISNVASSSTWLGLNGSVSISYTLTNASANQVYLRVYNSSDMAIRTIDGGSHSDGTYTVSWDGCYDNGMHVPEGVYTLRVYVVYNSNIPNQVEWQWPLVTPYGLAVDPHGTIYIAETNAMYGWVRTVNTDGTNATIGGEMANMRGMAVDSGGNIYTAEYTNNDVKKIFPNGSVTTLATGFKNPYAVAVDSADNVYVADAGNNATKMIYPNGTVITIASGFKPYGVAVDNAGDVYVSDYGNNAVKMIYPNGTVITIASGFKAAGIALDSSGNVYATDYSNKAVKEIYANGTVITLASGFNMIFYLAIDTSGKVYVADGSGNKGVYVINPNGTASMLYANNLYLNAPKDVAIDQYGNMYVSEYGNKSISEIYANGTKTTIATGFTAYGIALDSVGNVYSVDYSNKTVKEVYLNGTVVSLNSTEFGYIYNIAVGPDGVVYTADTNKLIIYAIHPDGTVSNLISTGANYAPKGIAVDNNNNVYWSTQQNNGVFVRYADGSTKTLSTAVRNSEDVAVDTAGDVYVADAGNNAIRMIYPNGSMITLYSLSNSMGLGYDSFGSLYVVDSYNITKLSRPMISSDSLSISADLVSPVTSCKLYGENSSNVFTGKATVNLTAFDPSGSDYVSGVKATMYSLDGTMWMKYIGNISITATGDYTLYYYSTDNAGNAETIDTVDFSVAGLPVILAVNGSVSYPMSLTMADLNEYPNMTVNATYGSKTLNGTGASLNAILNDSGLLSGANSVTFIASDYNATIALSTIRADPNAVIMYTDNGTLRNVIPSQGSAKQWVSNLSAMTVNQNTAVADFNSNVTSGNVPLTVQFIDSSTDNPAAWSWSFGDGGTSASQNPVHKYNTVGTYTVSLTVTNSAGGTTTTKTGYITVNPQPPVAAFTKNVTNGVAPLTVQFTDASTGSLAAWKWDFGDGASSTLQNPVHTFSAPGNYTVVLNASNAGGFSTASSYVNVINGSELALTVTGGVKKPLYLTMASLYAYPQISVNTTYHKNNDPTAYWLNVSGASLNAILDDADVVGSATNATFYGTDGYFANISISSIRSNPSAVIAVNSPPEGTLRVVMPGDTYGMDWVYNLYKIKVNQPLPVANFTANATGGKASFTVQFTDTSSNDPSSWHWDFGDGNTSTLQNPTHTYGAMGNYTVSLNVTNAAGSNKIVKASYVSVSPAKPIVLKVIGGVRNPLYLSMDDLLAYPQITENVSYVKVTGPTVYYINVTGPSLNAILDDAGVVASATTVTLDGQSPDGSYGAEISLSQIRSDPGAIIAIYPDGSLRDIIPVQGMQCVWLYDLTTIIVNQPAPVADFVASPVSGQVPLTVQFTDTSANDPSSWYWDFGDGETMSALQNPVHEFVAPGNYTVSLTATNSGGSDTVSKAGYISVNAAPGGGSETFTLNLKTGWNLVSIPLINNSLWADQLQGTGVTAVATYNKTSNSFDPYVVGKSPLGDDKQITIDKAYYMYSTKDTSITIRGYGPSERTISLTPGWNMVGWSTLNSSNAMDVAGSISGDQAIARYNTARGAYDPYVEPNSPTEDSFTMQPGEGYFIWTTNTASLTYEQTTSASLTYEQTTLTISPTTSPTVSPMPGEVVLTVTGNVTNPLSLTMAQLQAYPLISKNVSYVEMGSSTVQYMDVTGASLSAILDNAGVWSNASVVVFTGSDNVSAPIPISEILGDPDSMVAFNAPPHNSLRNIIPSEGSPGSWIYDLVSMEVQ